MWKGLGNVLGRIVTAKNEKISIDALLPPAIAMKAEDIGVAKVNYDGRPNEQVIKEMQWHIIQIQVIENMI